MREPPPVPTLDELLRNPERALGVAPEQAKRLLLALAPVERALELAAQAPAVTPTPKPSEKPSENGASDGGHLLTPDEAAAIAHVPRRVIYGWSRRKDWRFARRLSRKVLRIEEPGFRRWLARPR